MRHTVQCDVGGKTLTIESGWVAGQADGSVTLRIGDTVILVTACMSPKAREGIDFFPLSVDFEERLYAVGKIPGSFFRREGRPGTDGILAARLTDRPIRPLFPKGFRNEVQIVATVFSADRENPPDVLSIVGASAALSISSIPFEGPIAGCRVGYVDGQFVVNPSYQQMDNSSMELVVAGSRDAVVMVEAGAKEVPESLVLDALDEAQRANAKIIDAIEELVRLAGKPKVTVEPPAEPEQAAFDAVTDEVRGRIKSAVFAGREKGERDRELGLLEAEVAASVAEDVSGSQVAGAFDKAVNQVFRHGVLRENVRADGRERTQVRPITCEVGVLPRTHGTGLFTRGQTQILSVVTLGSLSDEQRLDTLSPIDTKRYMHHYNFPPYSVGEVRRVGSPGRREIGHGALAERALEPMIPSKDEFPYTIRVVSEALSSNGSTSMGSVCGSTMSLMDAGVPIKAPVAGVAMGLIMGEDGEYAVLTDIQGLEDHLGDMDFKVAGSAEGITALQMDIKVKGITPAIMREALAQAKDARLFILDKILQTIPATRGYMSPFAPQNDQDLHPRRQDWRGHRARRQDHPRNHRRDQGDHRRAGRRHSVHRLPQRGGAGAGPQQGGGPDQGSRNRLHLQRQGGPQHQLWRIRGDPARQGWPRALGRAGRGAGGPRRGRRQHRRHGQGHGDRGGPAWPRQPLPTRRAAGPHA